MVDIQHKNITGADAAHPPFYASESDPTTTLGAYRGWIKPSTGEVWIRNAANTDWIALSGGGGGSGGHTIQDEGSNLTARSNLNFTGAGVTVADDSVNDQTDVTIPGGTADPASEITAGIIEIATQAETNAGTDDARAITPEKLAGRTASETQSGVIEVATQTETNTGTDDARAVTPAKLVGRSATETRAGVIEIATQVETDAGTDDTRAVTPAKLANYSGLGGGTGLSGYSVTNETVDRTYDADATSIDEMADVLGTVINDLSGGGGGGGLGYRNLVELGSDVSNSTTSFADVTGLSFAITNGTKYRWYAMIVFTSAASTTGAAFSASWGAAANGTTSWHVYRVQVQTTGTSLTSSENVQADVMAATAAPVQSPNHYNLAIIEGFTLPNASATNLQIRFASEVGGSAIVVKAGSTLEWW